MTCRHRCGGEGPDLGHGDLEVREDLEEIRLELLVGAVDFVDQEHTRARLADRLEQGAPQQVALGEDVRLGLGGAHALALARLDGQQLALVVPLVDGGGHIQPFVALQADEPGVENDGEGLGDLGLADAGLTLDEQGAFQIEGERDRRHQGLVGDVAGLCEPGPECVRRVVHRVHLAGPGPGRNRARTRRAGKIPIGSIGSSVSAVPKTFSKRIRRHLAVVAVGVSAANRSPEAWRSGPGGEPSGNTLHQR